MNSSTCWYHLHHVGLHWTTMYRRWWLCRQGNRSTVVIVLLVIVDLSDRSNFSAFSPFRFFYLRIFICYLCTRGIFACHHSQCYIRWKGGWHLKLPVLWPCSWAGSMDVLFGLVGFKLQITLSDMPAFTFSFLFSPLLSFPAAVWRTIRIKSKLLPGPVLSLVCCCTCADICVCVL